MRRAAERAPIITSQNVIGRGLVEIGHRWERGELTVLDEHAASEKLARALQRTAESLSSDPASPNAVLATAEGDEHTLGLSLAELVLRESGWSVRWAGRLTPTSDLVHLVNEGSIDLVVLSASESSTDVPGLARRCENSRRYVVGKAFSSSSAVAELGPNRRSTESACVTSTPSTLSPRGIASSSGPEPGMRRRFHAQSFPAPGAHSPSALGFTMAWTS